MEQQKISVNSWRLLMWGIVVGLLGAGAFAAWQLRGAARPAGDAEAARAPGDVPMAPVDAERLRRDVLALTDLDPEGLAQLLSSTAEVEALAQRAGAGKTNIDPHARAQALVEMIGARRAQQAYVEWSRVEPRIDPPLTAGATARALQGDKDAGAQRKLYPLEVAALGVAALRSLGVPALLAEIYAYDNEPRPLDPSGRFGYFGVFVATGSADAQAPIEQRGKVYDVYGGRVESPAPADFVVLNDAQAVGAALAVRAMQALRVDLDIDAAARDSQAALKLLPQSSCAHAVRAAVLLTVGHPAAEDGKEGQAELETAHQLRDGPAQRTNLALHSLTKQDVDAALKQLGDTLEHSLDYALAHVAKGAAMLMRYDFPGAREQLDIAEKLDPQLAFVPQMQAQLLAAAGKSDEALVAARKAVAMAPQDAGALFILARIEQRLGLKDDLRRHAAQLVARTPAQAREARAEQVRRSMGEDALPAAGASAELPKAGGPGSAPAP